MNIEKLQEAIENLSDLVDVRWDGGSLQWDEDGRSQWQDIDGGTLDEDGDCIYSVKYLLGVYLRLKRLEVDYNNDDDWNVNNETEYDDEGDVVRDDEGDFIECVLLCFNPRTADVYPPFLAGWEVTEDDTSLLAFCDYLVENGAADAAGWLRQLIAAE